MVISLHTTQSPVSRSERMKINENWQRIIEGLSKLQLQINILAGGEEVDELILRINQAIEMVSTALQDTEKVIIEANKATMNAQEASDNANTAVQVINEAMGEAGQLMANLDALKAQLEQMKYKLETLSTEAEAATINANNAAQVVTNLTDAIGEAITVANNATQEANNAAQLIAGWGTASVWNATTEYGKNNITTYNGSTWQSLTTNKNSVPSESNKDWILLAQRGVDGTGSVSMVAGKSPDADGNVPLTSIDIGAETPSGAQEKANKIQEWVQAHGLGTNQPELISLPDSLLNKKESGFWNVENEQGSVSLPNDIEDFHVYVGMKSDDQSNKIYQTFLAISQKTAKTYTRVITNDGQVNNHLDDTGWIEGGEGGTGSGLKLNINTYDFQTTMDHQKTWDLPKELYDKNNDEIIVFHNGIYLPPISWDITGNASSDYVLTIPDNPIEKQKDNNVSILIFKNVPTTGDEQFSGSLLTDGSVTMNKLSQDVQDRINSASEKVEIVDNLTVGGSNKALSAEMGKNIKAIVDEKVDKTELDVLKTEVNEHLEQIALKANNSWQKGVYNDTDITNIGARNAVKVLVFNNEDWGADNTIPDACYINIPFETYSGTIKLTISGDYFASNAMGGAEVIYQVGKVGDSSFAKSKTIVSVSPSFAEGFYIGDCVYQYDRMYIPITRRTGAINPIAIKLEFSSTTPDIFNRVKNIGIHRDAILAQPHPWTPQSSQIPTYEAMGRWDNVVDRFPHHCKVIDSWNNAIFNGYYMTQPQIEMPNPTHAPDTTSWWMGTVTSHNQYYIVQSAKCVTDNREFERQSGTEGWGPWIETSPRKLFQSVSNGKAQVASAITGKGVQTASDATFSQMANNINAIPTGNGVKTHIRTITIPAVNAGQTTSISVTTPFKPTDAMINLDGRVLLNTVVQGNGWANRHSVSDVRLVDAGNGNWTTFFDIRGGQLGAGEQTNMVMLVSY